MSKPVKKSNVDVVENTVVVGTGMKVVFADVKVKGMSLHKKDKGMSATLNDANDAESGTAQVILRKFPESFCKPIANAGQGVYQVYKSYGIVVGNHYAIPIASYPKFAQALKEAINKFNLNVSALRDAVQTGTLQTIAMAQQGKLYNPDNDISVDDVDRTFAVIPSMWKNMNCKGINDAMAILGEETLATIEDAHKKAIENAKKISAEAGVRKVASEISTLVNDIVEKCTKQDQKGVQWKTIVKHIQDAIQTLPTFNVTDNEIVKTAISEMEKTIGTVKEYELKNDEAKRKELLTGANAIAQKFAGMFQD